MDRPDRRLRDDASVGREAGVCGCDGGGFDARRTSFDAGDRDTGDSNGDSAYSLRFFGNGGTYDDRVRVALDNPDTNTPGPAVDVGASDFTIEFWMNGPAWSTDTPY